MFYAVRQGFFRGVFTNKHTAMKAIRGHKNPKIQEFFNRKIAETYVYDRPTQHCVVYTDGSYRNRKAAGGYGVFFGMRDKRNLAGRLVQSRFVNSQRAEVVAACVALLVTRGKLEIRTDSLHLIHRATIYPYYKGKNMDAYEILQRLCRNRPVVWTYVKAHSDNFGNDNADVLARFGCRSRKKTSYLEITKGTPFRRVGACVPI